MSLNKVKDPDLLPVVVDHLVKNLNTINGGEEQQDEETLQVIKVSYRNWGYAILLAVTLAFGIGYLQ